MFIVWQQLDGEVFVNLESLMEVLKKDKSYERTGLDKVLNALHLSILKDIGKKNKNR